MSDESDEEYLGEVLSELTRREARLAILDADLARLRHRLEQGGGGAAVRSGDVVLMRAEARFKKQLQTALERKQKERERAANEVKMARDRLEMIEEEIAEKA